MKNWVELLLCHSQIKLVIMKIEINVGDWDLGLGLGIDIGDWD